MILSLYSGVYWGSTRRPRRATGIIFSIDWRWPGGRRACRECGADGEEKLRAWVPFYLWDRHILKSTGNLVADTPGRAVIGQQVSKLGKDKAEALLGQLPEFLQGAIPLSMLGIGSNQGDRTGAILTSSLNPFATLGELAGVGQSIAVGHNKNAGSDIFGQVNPLLTGAAGAVTGTNLLTGAPQTSQGGIPTSVFADLFSNFPEYKIAKGVIQPPVTTTKSGKPKMFATNATSGISSFLGVPVRDISKSATAAAARKEQGLKKPKKNKHNPFS